MGERGMEGAEKESSTTSRDAEATASLFPLFAASNASGLQTSPKTHSSPWLSNASFTTDLSVISEAVSRYGRGGEPQLEEEEPAESKKEAAAVSRYGLVDSSESDRASFGRWEKKRRKRKRKKEHGGDDDRESKFWSMKSVSFSRAGTSKTEKDYYFDSRGDRDNLAFGCIYRMDLARYKPYLQHVKQSGLEGGALCRRNSKGSALDSDSDIDALDGKLKLSGRYWSAKYSALERHKNFKRMRIVAPKKIVSDFSEEAFIPLLDEIDGSQSISESWEDEVLRRTREFNKMTREHPLDVKTWLAFAEFQDKVASMQPQKGARIQTREKKISILEKATELNPESEDLMLNLLKAYQGRDGTDVLITRWENVLMQNSGNCRLWKEFLHVVQGDFSRFKVSWIRKMYGHALQALSAACSKNYRQVHQIGKSLPHDSDLVELELGLVEIFVSLCRFEWQSGYQELATALFQAEIEYCLFSPSLLLTEHSKQRLFEYFWNSDGSRVGEEGALGWSTWLEIEEENRQKVVREEEILEEEDKGGWTGWSEPLSSKQNEARIDPEVLDDGPVEDPGDTNTMESEDDKHEEDDTEALLKTLGIDVNSNFEVKDASTWRRWAEEESSRDCEQWMPVRGKAAGSDAAGEVDEHLARSILFEDVKEYLFSLTLPESRISLLLLFIDFLGGDISQWVCSNSSIWSDRTLSLEAFPDPLLQDLRRIYDALSNQQSSSTSFDYGLLLGYSNHMSKRADAMKFLRNVVLLSLNAFPRNYILEEVALVAEELSNAKIPSVTPCRALAKSLLKKDRKDILLCGVYARREAAHGNVDHARKVFDMALTSIDGLPMELQSNAPILYLWYAEMELSNNFENLSESTCRAIHLLYCLGCGIKYSPFKNRPSGLQLLRARQVYKEGLKMAHSRWVQGEVEDHSVALACSAALFEYLTTGAVEEGIAVLNEAFSMVLPERKRKSCQLENLFNYMLGMIERHYKQSRPSKQLCDAVLQGLQIYPFSHKLFCTLLEFGHRYTVPNRLRRIFDDLCHKKPSLTAWLFALLFEMSRDFKHRVHGLFERALANDCLHGSVILWRLYIVYEIKQGNMSAARQIFFRAIHACPWSKMLWLDGFLKLNSVLTAKELSGLQEVMRDKELNMRTDIYEILLQDEMIS